MKKSLLLIPLFVFVLITICPVDAHNGSSSHNYIHELNVNYHLYNICKYDLEGFSKKISGGDYNYPSLREDLGQAMISRATTGKMSFEFLTSVVPNNFSKDQVSFFFLSDIDLNLRAPYDVFVEEKLLLTFQANEDGSLSILNNQGNGNAAYFLIKRDHNGDGVGAFRLTMPSNKIKNGHPVRIKVQGHKKGSNSWFMITKGSDIIERLKMSVDSEVAYSIKQSGELLYIDAPAHFHDRQIQIISDGKKSKKGIFKKEGDLAKVIIAAQPPQESFELVCNGNSLAMEFDNHDGISAQTEIIGYYFLYHKTFMQNGWNASITKMYRPDFFNIYTDFFDRKYEKGKVAIMNSSHQDIAWVDRPEVCIILRDTLLLTPILEDANERPDYGFDIEDGLMLREYFGRHPEARNKISALLNKQLISVGATYNCPYEDMYDSEDQVRQLYLGKKWIKEMFDYNAKVYWNVDVPGKSLQTPQILKKAGVDYMVISRHAKGMFHWKSPDGSSVFTYSPGHYGNDLIHLSKEMGNKIKYGAEQVAFWDPYYQKGNNHTPLLSSQDMLPAIDYSGFIDSWNNFKSVKDPSGKAKPVFFPDMELMTVDEFMPHAENHAIGADTIQGERPNVWLYIHGPSHHEAITASRMGSKLIPAAEKFNVISWLIDPARMPYPSEKLNQAWLSKIYPDHGWGGHDGDITDNLFKEKLVESRVLGDKLLNRAISFLASQIKTNKDLGIPVVLFNSLSWDRTDPVTIDVQFTEDQAKDIKVVNTKGEPVLSQISKTRTYDNGDIKSAKITFVASVPSIGYSTYYIKPLQVTRNITSSHPSTTSFENKYYLATLSDGGITQIFDKELDKKLFKQGDYAVGDVFTLQSIGNGAGEFGDVQQPFMADFDRVSDHGAQIQLLECGDVYTIYRIRQPILHAIVEQDITFYSDVKQIRFETRLLNWSGEMYREFRTAYPVNIDHPTITYEVPFGAVQVGKDEIKTAGERYTPLCKDVHPRAMIDWISASNEQLEIVLSSSVAVADWIDPADENNEGLLQHVLLASRKSCHFEGNEYSQAGNHDYSHILTSNKAGDIFGRKMAEQFNEPIHVVVFPDQSLNAKLPESESFFSQDQDNVIISSIKKAEDSNQVIVRIYNTEDVGSKVNLASNFKVNQVFKTNIIEEYPEMVKTMDVGKYGIETFLLKMDK